MGTRASVRQDNRQSTADLLTWAVMIDEGVVLCKTGAMLGGWYYRGPDLATASPQEKEHIAQVVNQALTALDGDYMIHVDAGRVPASDYPRAEESHFPDPVTARIDQERREQIQAQGARFETVQSLILTYLPPDAGEARLANFVFDDDTPKDKTAEGRAAALHALRVFHAAMDDLEDRLSAVLTVERMGKSAPGMPPYDELLSHLYWTTTGELAMLQLPEDAQYLDAVINGHEIFSGTTPHVGDKYVQVLAIDGFPSGTFAGCLEGLSELAAEYRWSTRFILQSREAAKADLHRYRRQWNQRVRSLVDQLLHPVPTAKSVINQDAAQMAAETETALSDQESGLVSYGYYSATLVMMGPDLTLLQEQAREARRIILAHGFAARLETLNAMEAWLGSLPGHIRENVRRPMVHTLHLANLLPLATSWTGEQHAPCPQYPPFSPPLLWAATAGSTPYRLNLHVGDVGHTLMFGPTGAGKSTALGLIAAQFRRYADARVFVFDKGHSAEALCRAVGGSYYEVTGDAEGLNFCPLARATDPENVGWAAEWVETLVELQGHTVTVSERNEITRALRALAGQASRTLTALEIEIQSTPLKEMLKQYTIGGRYGELLDADQAPQEHADFVVWEVGELMNREARIHLPVLLHLFREMEVSLDGSPTLVILDEAWVMLGHPVFREKIREWLKTLRKHNCAVLLATQSLADAIGSGIVDLLVESCATRIFLPNPGADQGDTPVMYKSMGISPAEVQAIKAARPKREYYVTSAMGSRMVDLSLGPVALAFVGVDPSELPAIRERERRDGADWPRQYLAERGL